jgi:hypothetical protein
MNGDQTPMRLTITGLIAACLVTLAASAGSAAPLPGLDARYRVGATGLEVGRAALTLDTVPEGLAVRFTFENDAVLGLIEPSLMRMRGLAGAQGAGISPRRFEGAYRKDDRLREVSLAYAPDGSIKSYELRKQGKVRLTQVPNGLAGTVDPMAAVLRVRAWLDGAAVGDELPLSVFDGRRRYVATVRYLGRADGPGAEGAAPVHRLVLRYAVAAQLDEDTGKLEAEPGARTRELALSLSADGRYLPLAADGSFDGLPLTAALARDCAAQPGCSAPE